MSGALKRGGGNRETLPSSELEADSSLREPEAYLSTFAGLPGTEHNTGEKKLLKPRDPVLEFNVQRSTTRCSGFYIAVDDQRPRVPRWYGALCCNYSFALLPCSVLKHVQRGKSTTA